MDEQTKSYLRVAGYVFCFIIICAICWSMLHDNGGTTDTIREQLDTAREQQQQTERTLESIGSGLTDSQRTVGELEQSNSYSQRTIDDIARTNDAIKESINDTTERNTECTTIINDSQQRISESKSIIENVRKTTKTNENTN